MLRADERYTEKPQRELQMPMPLDEMIAEIRTIVGNPNVDANTKKLANAILYLVERSVRNRADNRDAFAQIEELGKRREPE